MKIIFRNLSDKHIELTSEGETHIIASGSAYELYTYDGQVSFSLNPYEKSFLTYFIRKAGVIRKKNFCTVSDYKAEFGGDTVINLKIDRVKGKFSDIYRRVSATVGSVTLAPESFRVIDEAEMKKEFTDAKKRGNRTIFLFDVLDILKSGLIVFLLLLIPFALIWIFGSLETAYTICGYLFIPIFIMIIIFNRIFDRLKKKLWYFAKGKALKNSTYKGTDSHFEEEYMREIF